MKKSNQILTGLIAFCLILQITSVFATKMDFWTTLEPMPSQLGGSVKAGVVFGKIYVMGNSLNFEYDPITDVWIEKTPLPTPRESFGLAVSQNKIYVIGGSQWTQDDGVINYRTNEVYNPMTDTWDNKEPMPANRTGLWGSTNTVGNQIHLIADDFHDIYDVVADKWTTGTPMPIPQSYTKFSSTVFENKIFVLGENATQIYNPISEIWSFGTPSPIGTYLTSACATTGIMASKRIYVFGGEKILFSSTNITQIYDPIGDKWSIGEPMLTARSVPTCVVLNDVIYVLGGMSGRLNYELVNEQYHPIGYIPEFSSFTILVASFSIILVLTIIYRIKFFQEMRK